MWGRFRASGRPGYEHPSPNHDLTDVAAVASAITGIFDLDSLLRTALQELLTLFEAEKGAVHLSQSEGQQLLLHTQRGFSPEYVRRHPSLEPGEQIPGMVAQTGTLFLLSDASSETSRGTDLGGEDFQSVLCAPLSSNSEVLGTVTLIGTQPGLFDEVAAHLLEFIARHISAGIQSIKLVEDNEKRVNELAALGEIRQAIGSTLDLMQVLKLVARKTAQACGVERCSLMLLDEQGKTLVPMMSQFASGEHDERLWRLFRQKSLAEKVDDLPVIARVIRQGKTSVLSGESISRLPAAWAEQFGVKSVLLVPLIARDKIIGLMALDYTKENSKFSTEQMQLATAIGSQVSMAIENARLYARQERRAIQLNVINQVGRRATSSLHLDVLLQETAAAIQEAFDYDFVSILVSNEETNEMIQRADVGRHSNTHLADYRQSMHEGLIGWAVKEGEATLVNDVARDPRYLEGFPETPFTKSELVVPIKVDGRVVAVLDVQSAEHTAFDRTDLMSMQAIADQLGVSVRNARLYEESKSHLDRLEVANRQLVALQQTGASLARTLDLQQVLQAIADGVVQGLGYHTAAIAVVDKTGTMLENILVSGLSSAQLRELERIGDSQLAELRLPLKDANGVVSTALSERKIVVTDRLHQLFRSLLDQTLSEVAQELLGVKTLVTVPLVLEDRPLGALCAATEKTELAQEELASLRALANQASLAIENAQLYQRTIARLDQLSALHQISMAATSTLDLDQILASIVQALRDTLQLSNLAIMLIDDTEQRLRITAGTGYAADIVERIQPKLGEGITGWVASTGQPLNVPDVTSDPRYIAGDENVRSEVCVPLTVGKRTIGVLNVESRQPAAFSDDTVRFLATLAGQLAVTIENARLFQRVAQGEKDWEDTFRSITDGIAIYGEDLTVNRANPALAQILEMPLRSLIGKHCYELFSYCYGTSHPACPHRRAIQNNEPTSVEVEEPQLRKTLHLTSFPIFAEDGNSKGTVHAVRDVTEEKALRAQLLQTEKLAAIGQLVSGVAHELNNPLTSVMGYSQLLLAADLEPEVKEDLKTIHREAQRSAKIIENLLTFARRERALKGKTDVNQILRDTVALRSYQLKVDNIELIDELDEHLPATMAAPHQLQQVFLNLMNNAHQALTESEEPRCLVVRSERDEGKILVKIVDNGPGIPEEYLSKIFDPFFTTKEVGQGTGLGLSIAFGIVQEHGGTIHVESKPGEGTSFTVELPIVSDSADETRWPPPEADAVHLEGYSALIIDDEPEVLEVIERVLTRIGYRAVVVTSAEAALERLREERYDLAICDVRMPGMDGSEFYQMIRETYPELARRFIFSTGDSLSGATRSFLETAGCPYVSKPFTIEELQSAIQEAVQPVTGYPSA
jgi:two-component system NtrC family sensor kinase